MPVKPFAPAGQKLVNSGCRPIARGKFRANRRGSFGRNVSRAP